MRQKFEENYKRWKQLPEPVKAAHRERIRELNRMSPQQRERAWQIMEEKYLADLKAHRKDPEADNDRAAKSGTEKEAKKDTKKGERVRPVPKPAPGPKLAPPRRPNERPNERKH